VKDAVDARNFIAGRLEKDLVGPRSNSECLLNKPSDIYLFGFLSPQGSFIPPEEDQGELDVEGDDEEVSGNEAVSTHNAQRPASMGISFAVRPIKTDKPEVVVRVSCGTYENTDYCECDTRRARYSWQRVSHDLSLLVDISNDNEISLDEQGLSGLSLYVKATKWGESYICTLALINKNAISTESEELWLEIDKSSFFQAKISIEPTENSQLVARPVPASSEDEDGRISSLIYRSSQEFAVGHNCSAGWKLVDKNDFLSIQTEWIPKSVVKSVKSSGDVCFEALYSDLNNPLSVEWLSQAGSTELCEALGRFINAYEGWIDSQSEKITQVDDNKLHNQAYKNIKNCQIVVQRMRETVEQLKENTVFYDSFKLSNQAMLMQWNWSRTDTPMYWRPFQLGFLLLSMISTVYRSHKDRDIMDLLWFPTGGGKTEAYLALSAFLIFFRRASQGQNDDGEGVAVFMRYTLRTLTVQQFQRAAAMILACEVIRKQYVASGGRLNLSGAQFSIGMWVGGDATPNRIVSKDGGGADEALRTNAYNTPAQVEKCPCCKTQLLWSFNPSAPSIEVRCTSESCLVASEMEILPIWTVDDDVYRERPSLVIGTVDKYAQITRQKSSVVLFGKGTPHAPPDLIIQDELHLISGPLGTMAGLYETLIDELCSADGFKAKVIGSTATIRRSREQIRALFDREGFQFPPPAIDADNSGFAVVDYESPGRLYLGLSTVGRSAKFALQAISASLLQSAYSEVIDKNFEDSYWTLVAYFNSLRELGGALVLMQDDVPDSINEFASRHSEHKRVLGQPVELTSRVSSKEVRDILGQLERPKNSSMCHDVVLATNMISVGVDIPRLGVMLVNGQPKTMAEYIQATSRVGRGATPGLVVVLYNHGKTRDRSHYESFGTWHNALYRTVEATSVTPFSSRSRDKAMKPVFASLARYFISGLFDQPKIDSVSTESMLHELVDRVERRVKSVDPDEASATRVFLEEFIDYWKERYVSQHGSKYELKTYWNDRNRNNSLMMGAEKAAELAQLGFEADLFIVPAPNSLRNVEPSTTFMLREFSSVFKSKEKGHA